MGHGGRRDQSEYITITAEVFYDTSQRKNGVRPWVDQPYAQTMKIECAKEIRNYPIGTKVRLDVVETEKEGSRPFLYCSYKWKHYVIENS